jgi:hypothetical protein
MSFNVTASGSSGYLIDGESNKGIDLVRGNVYTFIINAPGHPFWIQTSTGYSTDNTYSNIITNNGTDNGILTFNVQLNAPNILYYVCQNHPSSMNGIIYITSSVPTAPTNISATTSSSSSASVSFTLSPGATSYTVTSSPGSITATSSSSPITITGLNSGTSYTFTVTATGTGGTSSASSASPSIITSSEPEPQHSRVYPMRSLYTNNAQVYYKPHSLYTTGSVINSRHKQRRT